MIRAGICLLFGCAIQAATTDPAQIERDLEQIARTATAMVDGDVCQRIVTDRALEFMDRKDTRDPWVDSDNYDVNDATFIAVKKTLMRLATLAEFPADVNLWMPLPGSTPRIHIVIRNSGEMSQFWEWGKLNQPMFPEMHNVLTTGQRTTVKKKPGFISVLAPVRNSLGEVVGLVEVVTRIHPDARENVK